MQRLSVLDQSPVPEGSTGADALANTLDLARLTDGLGYHRYWLAEHHGGPSLAGPSPEALIGPVAAATSRIRVGSGGVMLPHYSPFKVAETFSVLAGLFPGRIDLGIGRAAGTDPMTTFALQRDRRTAGPDDFPQQLAELLAHYDGAFPLDHPFARLGRTLPGGDEQPEVWLLGSSPQSAIWAAQLGLPYAFADFINPDGAAAAAQYRDGFEPSERLATPRVAVAVWAVCADTDEEAQRLAASGRMTLTLLRQGRLIPVPPPEKALRFLAEQGADPTGAGPRPPRRDRLAGDGAGRDRGGGCALRSRGGDRRDDHLGPRRPAALLRADRRRLRPRGRRRASAPRRMRAESASARRLIWPRAAPAAAPYRAALLDWMACAVRGRSEPAARAAAGAGDGLLERVAALGAAGHVLDFDDTYLPGIAHLSAPVAPAAIAVGAAAGATVGDVLDAYALGFEAMGALARAGHPALYDRGWHPTAVCGGVGAATAAAALLGAPAETAVALAALRAGGLRAAFGSDGKSLQVGLAAASGVAAAQLAAAGASVPRDRIATAWRDAYGGEWAEPGDGPRAVERNWIKAWPCCLQTHGAIECAERVRGGRRSARRPAHRARPPGIAPGGGLRRRRDAAPGEVLDPLHDRLHAAARRPARRRVRRGRRRRAPPGLPHRGPHRPRPRRVGVRAARRRRGARARRRRPRLAGAPARGGGAASEGARSRRGSARWGVGRSRRARRSGLLEALG